MDWDQEIRMQCLHLANARVGNAEEIVRTAEMFNDFVRGRSSGEQLRDGVEALADIAKR